ncbi:MAG: hypothetical protein HY001_04050 [Candidatus Portnoybacteria bacterium]|nr:hypothetical protein [Candidatus Portnoybacteria bacterium]
MDKLVIEGYGPPDLIILLRNAIWEPCLPSGENFKGIAFGNLVLAIPYDPYCPIRHCVTVQDIPQGRVFRVTGYQSENICETIRNGASLTLAGHYLVDPPLNKIGNLAPYRVIIEIV